MNGAIPLLPPPYAVMVWMGTALPLTSTGTLQQICYACIKLRKVH